MKLIYDLDDIYCEEDAHYALKKEIEKKLNECGDEPIDIARIVKMARNEIVSSVYEMYQDQYYIPGRNNFKSEESSAMDKAIFGTVSNCTKIHDAINRVQEILKYRDLYPAEQIEKAEKTLYELRDLYKKSQDMLRWDKSVLRRKLEFNTSIRSLVFQKLDNGKIVVQDWIKPYLDRISFCSLLISDLKNYDFSGTHGFIVHTNCVPALENAIFDGVTFQCNHDGKFYPIDPAITDITGADFTGSKGAVVTLEHVDELPVDCNLTDAKILVKSEDDIAKFKLEKYGDNVFLKQDSIVKKNRINVDFTDFFNYTGVINQKEYEEIAEALKFDCMNDEEIRLETNRAIAHGIGSELSNFIYNSDLFAYFYILKRILDHLDYYEDELTDGKPSKELIASNFRDLYLYTDAKCFSDLQYSQNDEKIRFYTKNGVFTLDLLRMGLSMDDIEAYVKGEKGIEVFDSINDKFATIRDIMCDYASQPSGNDVLDTAIFNNLEANNKGYSYTMKKTNV